MRTLIDEFGLAVVEIIAAAILLSIINAIICMSTGNTPTSPISNMMYSLFLDLVG